MTLKGFMTHDFFGQSGHCRPKINTAEDTAPSKPHNTKEVMSFLGKDLLTLLGQGPIKKSPKRSEKWLKEQQERKEEPLTPEMEKEIKEIF